MVESNKKITKFTDLISWQEAHKLVLSVYSVTKEFSADEKFGLVGQMRRAAISVTSNIAEGFGRYTSKDKVHFFTMSKTSLAELQNQMIVSKDLNYVDAEKFDSFFKQSVIVDSLIAGMQKSALDKVIHYT